MQRDTRDEFDAPSDAPTLDDTTPGIATVGVFDYALFDRRIRPMLEDVKRSTTATLALARLEDYIATDAPVGKRDDLRTQLERMRGSGNSDQPSWKHEAAGLFVEHACLDESTTLRDHGPLFRASLPLLTPWSVSHARTMLEFMREQNEHTIRWASAADIWRAALPLALLTDVAEAMSALSPHELERQLRSARDGSVFTPEEATEVREWWNSLRRILRLAVRMEMGLFVSVRRGT